MFSFVYNFNATVENFKMLIKPELSLDRTARLYNQAIKYRRQLMDQWSMSVHVLTQRDKAIYRSLQVRKTWFTKQNFKLTFFHCLGDKRAEGNCEREAGQFSGSGEIFFHPAVREQRARGRNKTTWKRTGAHEGGETKAARFHRYVQHRGF